MPVLCSVTLGPAGSREHYVKITGEQVTGRRLRQQT
jgi:hypothetical protein